MSCVCFTEGLPGRGFGRSGCRDGVVLQKYCLGAGWAWQTERLQSQQAKCSLFCQKKGLDMVDTFRNAAELSEGMWCSPVRESAEVGGVCSVDKPQSAQSLSGEQELPGLCFPESSASHCLLWCSSCIPTTAWACLGKCWHLRQLQSHPVWRNRKKSVRKAKSS